MSRYRKLPKALVRLGFTSLLTDSSTECMQPFIPFYLTQLGASGPLIGLVAGLNELLVNLLKFGFGWLSDLMRRRLIFVWSGYLISSICKLGLSLASTLPQALVLIPLERCGKGIRTSPRDALISQIVTSEIRGAAFGFHRAMDTGGAVIGALLALGFWAWGLEYHSIFLIAGTLGFLALVPLLGVREPERSPEPQPELLGSVNQELRKTLLVFGIFGLGYLSVMFMLLRAGQLSAVLGVPGLPLLLYLVYNCVYAGVAYPAGTLSDRCGRYRVLGLGYSWVLLGLGLAGLASWQPWLIVPGFILYGAGAGFVDGIQRSTIGDLVGARAGVGFGTYYCVFGSSVFAGNLIGGWLWDLSPEFCFMYGASVVVVALITLVGIPRLIR